MFAVCGDKSAFGTHRGGVFWLISFHRCLSFSGPLFTGAANIVQLFDFLTGVDNFPPRPHLGQGTASLVGARRTGINPIRVGSGWHPMPAQ